MRKIVQIAIMPTQFSVGELSKATGTMVVLTEDGRIYQTAKNFWEEVSTDGFDHSYHDHSDLHDARDA